MASPNTADAPCGSTSIQPGYTSPNFLMIMVDQFRAPRWLPPGGLPDLLPNIDWLLNHSISFSNYFVAAAACTPSRSTLLTGLYAQQTCLFQTQAPNGCQPPLQTSFPNIATVLGQSSQQIGGGWVPYTSYWIGKWHLSDAVKDGTGMGANGPADYGFTTTPQNLNLPPSNALPSPNGVGNLATEGYNPSGFHPTRGAQPPGTQPPDDITSPLYCDAAIVDFFLTQWLPNAPASPWFTAVSLVNPHDISAFPFSYNLNGSPGFGGIPPNHPTGSYPEPPPAGSAGQGPPGSSQYYDTYLPALPQVYSAVPANWNNPDAPNGMCNTAGSAVSWVSGDQFDLSWPGRTIIINGALYTIAAVASPTALTLTSSAGTHTGVTFTGSSVYNGGAGKPDMQAVFQNFINNTNGAVTTADGWITFLNYYFWMQQCVDVQIGRILGALSSPAFPDAGRTIVMLHSDHGDYGGSHSLKAKGGALYDESLNVPLYISFPRNRAGLGVAARLPFVCSSVDILPFFYAMALGSDYYWRQNPCDIIAYLNKRESIMDGIYSSQPKQYRLSGIPNQNGAFNGQPSQPFILHTTDEFPFAVIGSSLTPVQSHAVAFRTVDLTVTRTNGDGATVNGGGKLGVYSFWPAPTSPGVAAQTRPAQGQPQQFEFYDYTLAGNLGETGNDYNTNPNLTASFVNAYLQAGQGELYALNQYPWPANLQNAYNAALQAYLYSVSVCGNGTPSADQ